MWGNLGPGVFRPVGTRLLADIVGDTARTADTPSGLENRLIVPVRETHGRMRTWTARRDGLVCLAWHTESQGCATCLEDECVPVKYTGCRGRPTSLECGETYAEALDNVPNLGRSTYFGLLYPGILASNLLLYRSLIFGAGVDLTLSPDHQCCKSTLAPLHVFHNVCAHRLSLDFYIDLWATGIFDCVCVAH